MTKARDLGDFISDGTIAETVTADGLNLGDNEKIQLGASQDLQLYHDGLNSYISDQGTGNIILDADDSFQVKRGANYSAYFDTNAEVTLYHNNSAKLATTSTGATLTGTIAVSGDFNATSGTFTVQSNGTDILNVTSTLMSPQTDGAISIGSASNAFNDMYLDGSAYVSGNVGIGTNSPATTLHVNSGAANEVARFESTDTEVTLELKDTTGTAKIKSRADFRFETGATPSEAMRIDSSGKVGINTTTMQATFNVEGTDGNIANFSYSGAATELTIVCPTVNTIGLYTGTSDNFVFGTDSTERMRLDASGNLLVGKTANNLTDDGIVLRGSGELFVTRASDVAAFNRRSTDGDIVTFRRDGTTVGSIGSNNGNIKISAFGEEYAALSGTTPTVDCQSGNNFALSTTGNTTFTFSNPPTSGTAFGFTLKVTAGGTHTLTWPASVDWAGGTAPDAPASGETNVLVFITYDGGTTWYGFQAGAALA